MELPSRGAAVKASAELKFPYHYPGVEGATCRGGYVLILLER